MLEKVPQNAQLGRIEAFYDDVTVHEERSRTEEDKTSVKSEKQRVLETEAAVTSDEQFPLADEVPDGGLQAWLVVLGVSHISSIVCLDLLI